MVQPFRLLPNLSLASVEQTPSGLVGPGDVPQVILMHIYSADIDQVLARRSHACPVVASMQRIGLIKQARWMTVEPVDAAKAGNIIKGRLVARIEARVIIADFVQMQHDIVVPIEGLDDRLYKSRLDQGI